MALVGGGGAWGGGDGGQGWEAGFGIGDGAAGEFVEAFAHEAAGLELDGVAWGNFDGLEGARVLGAAGAAAFDFEDAEVAKLEALAVGELVDHEVKECGGDVASVGAFAAGGEHQTVDEVFLGGVHWEGTEGSRDRGRTGGGTARGEWGA